MPIPTVYFLAQLGSEIFCLQNVFFQLMIYQAGTRRCDNVGFWLPFGRDVGQRRSNVVTTLPFRRPCSDQNLTLQRRVFDVDFATRY